MDHCNERVKFEFNDIIVYEKQFFVETVFLDIVSSDMNYKSFDPPNNFLSTFIEKEPNKK